MSLEVTRINRVNNLGNIKAFADLKTETEIGSFVMRGFRIVESRGRIFVGFPSKTGSDNHYHLTVFTNDQSLKRLVNETILEAYNNGVTAPLI